MEKAPRSDGNGCLCGVASFRKARIRVGSARHHSLSCSHLPAIAWLGWSNNDSRNSGLRSDYWASPLIRPNHLNLLYDPLQYSLIMMASEGKQASARRRICGSECGRPANVCLCHSLPSNLIETATHIVILHHPHEQRHKLATVPLLSKCLANCHIIVGRKLRYGDSGLLDSLHDQNLPTQPFRWALFLFPGSDALALADVSQVQPSLDCADENSHVLIAFDGTWKHAKEMLLASLPFLSKFAIQVCLGFDVRLDGDSIFNSALILRKEPFSGCIEYNGGSCKVFKNSRTKWG